MHNLPTEIIEKVFEYLPLKEIVTNSTLNDTFSEAANRQLKRRCNTISFNLSTVQIMSDATIQYIFQRIGPNLRKLNVDILHTECVPSVVQRCPNLDTISFKNILEREYDYDLSGIKMPMSVKNLLITESHLGLDIISMYPNPIKKTQEILSNLRGVRKLGHSLTLSCWLVVWSILIWSTIDQRSIQSKI